MNEEDITLNPEQITPGTQEAQRENSHVEMLSEVQEQQEEQAQMAQGVQCPHCGALNEPEALFCARDDDLSELWRFA